MARRPRSRCGSMHKVDGSNVSSSVVGECGLAKSHMQLASLRTQSGLSHCQCLPTAPLPGLLLTCSSVWRTKDPTKCSGTMR